MLQFFSASTNIVNSKRAITECLENALNDEPDLNCDLIIIYSAMGHNFKDLLTEAHLLSPDARIAGCTCAGIIGKNGADESMTALAIMAMKGPKNEFSLINRKTKMGIDPFTEGAGMARELKNMNPEINIIQFLPTLFEWMPFDKAVKGIESIFGPDIPVFGGISIDNFKGISCFHFFDGEVIEYGAVMVGYADSTLKYLNHTNHGFDVIEGMSIEVTRSASHIIYELNGKPAWKFLSETLGIPENSHPTTALSIAGYAKIIPEELQKEYGSKYTLFGIMGKNEDNSIFVSIDCPKGTKFWLTKRDEKKMFDGVDWMIKNIVDKLQDRLPLAVFHADCALRGKFSLNRILKDELIHHIQSPICKGKNIPWLGFYSGGEIGRVGGQNWFHNFSSSLFVIYR
jgi:hypothetical protein